MCLYHCPEERIFCEMDTRNEVCSNKAYISGYVYLMLELPGVDQISDILETGTFYPLCKHGALLKTTIQDIVTDTQG